MSESQKDGDLTPLLSSYGLMTAERILAKYGIILSQQEILAVVRNRFSLYHKMLRLPFKNVLNGIIIQQAQDYYVYVQKLFVDYLLSGETQKSEDMPGVSTREMLEEERQRLLSLGDQFHQQKLDCDKLIAKSQSYLINYASSLKIASTQAIKAVLESLHSSGINIITIDKALHHAIVYADLSEKSALSSMFIDSLGLSLESNQKKQISETLKNLLSVVDQLDDGLHDFLLRTDSDASAITNFRSEFHSLILRTKELIMLLPEYKHDLDQETKNKESIDFDSSIV